MKDYIERWIQLAEDLVNTYDTYLAEPEKLKSPQDLRVFLDQQRIIFPQEVTDADVHAVRNLRDQLREIYTAADEEGAIKRVNALLAGIEIGVALAPSQQGKWQIQFTSGKNDGIARYLRTQTALGLMSALEEYGKKRLKYCLAEPCRDVFLDTSRNNSRRFCGEACANRYNVAHFRQRQRTNG